MNVFATMVKMRRTALRLGLREFCMMCEFDPSNWSKVERGLASPPKSPETIKRICMALGYREKSKEAKELRDNAFIAQGRIPPDIMTDTQLSARLPVFFRTVRGDKHTTSELRKLAELIRDSETAE